MILSHSKKFIFQRTKKTAGTSIEVYFQPWCTTPEHNKATDKYNEAVTDQGIVGSRSRPYNTFYDHMPVRELRSKLGDKIWKEYFKFCSVRNPWDKAVSRFYWETRNVKYDSMPFTEVQRLFNLFVRRHLKILWDDKLMYIDDGQHWMDFYVRYENLHEDLETVCERLDIPWQPNRLGQFKSGIRYHNNPYQDYYTDDFVYGTVVKHSKFEIDHFGYTF